MNPTSRGRATPDSEAVASSEDERPWPSSTSFGSLPRKENGVPGLGGGIWSTQKGRGSFKMADAARRNAAREVQLGAAGAHSSLRQGSTPSPSTSEGPSALPFAIPLRPTAKAGRSLSHSQGQRERPMNNGAAQSGAVLPLGLLTEENDPDNESDFGEQLTQTVSQPPIGTMQRSSTYSDAFSLHPPLTALNGRGRVDELTGAHGGPNFDGRLEAAFANLSFEQQPRRSQWQSHLGWDDVPNVNGSRRHSLADIPTRRGSLSGEERSEVMGCIPSRPAPVQHSPTEETDVHFYNAQPLNMRANEGDMADFRVPDSHKVPFIDIKDVAPKIHAPGAAFAWSHPAGRPKKQLYIVSFKCSRVDVFYLLDNTGLSIKEGDMVIVEADRGQDLGTVQHANVTEEQAKIYKRKYSEEQYKWLMMFSRNNNPSNVNPNAQTYGESNARGLSASAAPPMQGLPRDGSNNLKPKAIKRLANKHEIKMLGEKEGNEAKAKRACQQKVQHLHLQMEILEAEWQWDFNKLIFYYYADHYINFKDLITDLYRIYKVRIWLSAVNPASFSQHAMGQPPSGIGPGAITGHSNGLNSSYTMAYGQDPDPYGAVPPYRIGYETYNPNYPSIPGVANSFAPGSNEGGLPPPNVPPPTNMPFSPENAGMYSTVPPGVAAPGTPMEFQYYYARNGVPVMMPSAEPTPVMPHATPANGANINPLASHYYPEAFGSGSLSSHQAYPSPWSPLSASRASASGFDRAGNLPLPIGTRPCSDGNMSTPASSAAERRSQEAALSPTATSHSGQSRQSLSMPGFLGDNSRDGYQGFAIGAAHARSPLAGGFSSFERHDASDDGRRKVQSPQEPNVGKVPAYADEMSRER